MISDGYKCGNKPVKYYHNLSDKEQGEGPSFFKNVIIGMIL